MPLGNQALATSPLRFRELDVVFGLHHEVQDEVFVVKLFEKKRRKSDTIFLVDGISFSL